MVDLYIAPQYCMYQSLLISNLASRLLNFVSARASSAADDQEQHAQQHARMPNLVSKLLDMPIMMPYYRTFEHATVLLAVAK